jgi:hypothetical protein
VDDWGKLAPTSPTLFEYYRKQLGVPQSDVWVVASNKALPDMIGASSASGYGPEFGANLVFPKQLWGVFDQIEHGVQNKAGSVSNRDRLIFLITPAGLP